MRELSIHGRREGQGAGVTALACVLTLVAVTAATFAAVEALPGDAATSLLGQQASPGRVAEVRARLDLDQPAARRYVGWVAGVVTGDLGVTTSGQSVGTVLSSPARNSALLFAITSIATAGLVLGAALLAGTRPDRRADRFLSAASLGVVAIPEYVVATVMIAVLALGFGVLPAVSLIPAGGSPLDRPAILVIPATALVVTAGAYGFRLARPIVVAADALPHVAAARAAGLGRARVVAVHVLPLALGPLTRTVALLVPYLIGGTVVIEEVTGYPGLGRVLVGALSGRDVRVVEAAVLVIAVVTLASFVLAEVIAAALDRAVGRRTW